MFFGWGLLAATVSPVALEFEM